MVEETQPTAGGVTGQFLRTGFARERSMRESVFVSLIRAAAVHNGGLVDRLAHRPIDHAVLIEVGNAPVVKPGLVAIRTNVLDKLDEQSLVHAMANDILMRPRRRVRNRKRPAGRFNEGPKVCRQRRRHELTFHDTQPDAGV